ncbi:hypothetical protein HMPREF9419_1379 [Prevotella nigrescens ATCC 33563]|nr:hypothetical protein HMPREF9419_1379 [Prevotella nigrescens ATCC 33563]
MFCAIFSYNISITYLFRNSTSFIVFTGLTWTFINLFLFLNNQSYSLYCSRLNM